MKNVLIITGPGGDAQGWGNLDVTQTLCDTLNSRGKSAEIAFVNTMADFTRAIETKKFDIVWSALYYISDKEDVIGLNVDADAWLADRLDARAIPYIGPNAQTMKDLINKTATHRILKAAGVSVPGHCEVPQGETAPELDFPAFVKPSTESRSVGISDNSVVTTREELDSQVRFIHDTYAQPALIEDYLPGQEYTVLMLGNGHRQEFLPGIVLVEAHHYKKYPILRSDLRGVGITKIHKPESLVEESKELCRQACETLRCLDHVRVDMREDASGRLRVIEVNGIPGLKPVKSWSPQIFSLYHPAAEAGEPALAEYADLVHLIADSALERCGL